MILFHPKVASMTIVLTHGLELLIERKVASGRYATAGDVIEEALRLMDQRDRWEELREMVAVGVEQADRGELLEGGAVFDEIRQRIEARLGPQA